MSDDTKPPKITLPPGSEHDPDHPAWRLWWAISGQGVGSDEATEILRGYQRFYAHELAEYQRAEARRGMAHGPIQSWHQVLNLIDSIDPEAPVSAADTDPRSTP